MSQRPVIMRRPRQSSAAGNFRSVSVQRSLTVGKEDDPLEHEADKIADTVMRMPETSVQRKGISDDEEESVQRKPLSSYIQLKGIEGGGVAGEEVSAGISATRGSGQNLDSGTRSFMESRFGTDFGNVNIHTGNDAIQMNRDLSARAFTVGNDIYFNEGQYNVATSEGKHLLAHELTHTVQQNNNDSIAQRSPHYTEDQRRSMQEFREVGQQDDNTMAAQRHFQSGDIIFRAGSRALSLLMNQPVTHGGIFLGNGLIHDAGGLGNRNIRVTNFFSRTLGEAADPSIYRTVRFIGPHHDLIVARLLSNIQRHDFRMPTDPVPFNLFSTADDYRTATCLEYAHAQFLYAIQQLAADPNTAADVRASLRATYFTGTSTTPNALIRPGHQRTMGNTPDIAAIPQGNGEFPSTPPRTLSALIQADTLVAAATFMADDVDSRRFSNRNEGEYLQHYPASGNGLGSWLINAWSGMTYDEVDLRTFTYQSFVDSRQFFQDVTS